ncbi:hypothetical protein Y023_5961 [Burkholderia pseudomallei A79D]|nr:hypothetical protein X947_5840 [Burkholderia pseudomallei MSHR7334]KGX94210.1 hypothetical protein Y023_5961 [Burkholderia pseudomallei A79D]
MSSYAGSARLRSRPAQNAPPSPDTSMHLTPAWAARWNAMPISTISDTVKLFLVSGLLRVIHAIPSSTRQRTAGCISWPSRDRS